MLEQLKPVENTSTSGYPSNNDLTLSAGWLPAGALPGLSDPLQSSIMTSSYFSGSTLTRGTLDSTDPSNPSYPDTVSDDYLLTGLVVGQQVQVNLSTFAFDTYVQLVDANTGAVVSFDNDSGIGTNSQLTFTAQEGVDYVVRVTSFSADVTGSYWLKTDAGVTVPGTPISASESFNGTLVSTDSDNTLRPGSDYDGYLLTDLVVGQQVRVNLNSSEFDPYLQLVNADTGEVLAENDNFNELNSQLTFTVEEGIDYIVRSTSSSSGASGNYSLITTTLEVSSEPTVGTFSPTGDTSIDALLNGNGAYWDTSENGGVITYSFLDSESADSYYGNEVVSELDEAVKDNVREILEFIETFLNVDFVEVEDTATSYGVVRYMYSSGPEETGATAYAYYPNTYETGGDVHLDNNSTFANNPGSYGYFTIIHETLHALGLKHPGNYNSTGGGTPPPYLSPGEDNHTNTVMTYNLAGSYPVTSMAYDIRALQYLYGAADYNSGDTTYSFDKVYGYTDGSEYYGSSTTQLKQTLWDSGGTDVLDFSDLAFVTSGYYFDLSEGGILTTQSAYNGTTYTDAGGGGTYETTTFGTTIAFDTAIENLINSNSNDYIIANSAANTFSGYTEGTSTGDDVYEGTDALDLLILSSYSLSDLIVTVDGTDLFIDLGSSGSIEILDYYSSDGSMLFSIADNYYTYSESGLWEVAAVPTSPAPSESSNNAGVTGESTPVLVSSSTSGSVSSEPVNSASCHCPICSSASVSSFYQIGGTSDSSNSILA